MTTLVSDALVGIETRLRATVEARGARLALSVQTGKTTAEDRLVEPLQTILLTVASYAVNGEEFSLRAIERAGGDTEIIVTGIELPADFPASSRHADLWAFAAEFLGETHRARLGNNKARVMLLIPAKERARRLREEAQ